MRWQTGLLAVVYAGFASVAALGLFVYGAYDCYEECRYDVPNPPWPYDIDAWQWDAIFWLGVAGGVATVVFLVAAFALRTWAGVAALVVQLSLVVAAALFVRAAGDASIGLIAFVVCVLAAPAIGLIVLPSRRANSRAGAPGTRAGRNA